MRERKTITQAEYLKLKRLANHPSMSAKNNK